MAQFFVGHCSISGANIQPSSAQTFNDIICLLVAKFYNKYVFLPKNEEERLAELHSFIENYKFPRTGAWKGIHVYVSIRLKFYLIFQTVIFTWMTPVKFP